MKKQIKKAIACLLAFSMLSLPGTATVYASNTQEDKITYEGKLYSREALSKETIDWLEAYNGMSEDQRGMFNHVPYELRALQTKNMRVKVLEAGSELGSTSLRTSLLPLSGGETGYGPNYWNSAENIKRANCYAYAMDVICATETKLQPGATGGHQYKELSFTSFMTAMKLDGPYLGNGRAFSSGTETGSLPSSKAYKVALAFDTTGTIQDYHFYTQNSNGYWSHKRGDNKATNLDASGNYITNPRTCDRNYGTVPTTNDTANYDVWGGYIMVVRQ